MKFWRKKNEIAAVLFQIVNGHVLQLYLLSTIDISSVGENANGYARTGNIRKSIRKTLAWIVEEKERRRTLQFQRNACLVEDHSS
jgi:hypothetical protein